MNTHPAAAVGVGEIRDAVGAHAPRPDADTARLMTDQTDIPAAVARCLRARGWQNVHTTVPTGLTVRLDHRRFDVIVANLITNAMRYGGPPVDATASIQPDGQGDSS